MSTNEKSIELSDDLLKELDGTVREMFEEWKMEHPGVEVRSSTIKDPVQFMLVAMAVGDMLEAEGTDYTDESPVPTTELFAPESSNPETDKDALSECVEVLERIMRDDLLCGVGTQMINKNNQIERPLYGCVKRAIEHAKSRMTKINR